jgi:hypothetical protein
MVLSPQKQLPAAFTRDGLLMMMGVIRFRMEELVIQLDLLELGGGIPSSYKQV